MRRFLAATSVSLLLFLAACNKQTSGGPNEDTAKAAGLNTDEEKTIYSVGLHLMSSFWPNIASSKGRF